MMIRTGAAAYLAVSLLAVPAFAQANAAGGASQYAASQQDRQFLDHVARDNQGEIRLALLAEKQAASPAVKAFARLMIDDHAAFESQLANVLAELQVPSSNGMTDEDRTDMQKFQRLSGHQFDAQFMRAQIQDHAQDVRNLASELRKTHNPIVAGLVEGGLPIMRQHLALAEAVGRYVDQGSEQAMAARQR